MVLPLSRTQPVRVPERSSQITSPVWKMACGVDPAGWRRAGRSAERQDGELIEVGDRAVGIGGPRPVRAVGEPELPHHAGRQSAAIGHGLSTVSAVS